MSNVKIYSSETDEITYGSDFDQVYTDLHKAGKFVKGYWVAEESLTWIKENVNSHYFIIERNTKPTFLERENVLPVAASKKKVVLFADEKDAIHFKMVWI